MSDNLKDEKEPMSIFKKIIIFFSFLIVLAFGGIYYSRYIATTGLNVYEYKITNGAIPDSFHGAKLVHISDLHYKTTFFKKDLIKLVNKINELKPDVVVLTGDLFDRDTKYTSEDFEVISKELNKIDVVIGKYAVNGNHDTKIPEWETVIKNAGFINLNSNYDILYKNSLKPILLSGLESSISNLKDINERLKPTTDYILSTKGKELNNNIPNFKILLLHEPDYVDQINYQQFDLILAGHSHNGQVRVPGIGAIILPEGAKKYYKGYYDIDGTKLYISSGIGTSTIPYRLFNRPSINFYRLTNR